MKTVRSDRRAAARACAAPRGTVGLVPTMGALHAGHEALIRAARAENDVVVASLFVNPAQFDEGADLAAYPRDEERDAELAAERRARSPLRAAARRRSTRPASRPGSTWSGSRSGLEGDHRPGHFRGVATVCLKLFNIVRPQRGLLRPEGRAAGGRDPPPRPRPRSRARGPRRCRPSATRTGSRSPRGTRGCRPTSATRALALPRALATRDLAAARARCSPASTSTTSRSPTSTHPSSPPRSASAPPA